MLEEIIKKIESREAIIGIVGLGYVGLPLVLRFADVGFKVLGFDVDEKKNKSLLEGKSYIKHIESSTIKNIVDKGLFDATTDMSRLSEADVVIICVPTPLTGKREPDMSYVEATATDIAKYLRKGQLISLESTTYPGTTDELLLPKFTASGLTEAGDGFEVGKDFYLAYSPEREDPGRTDFSTQTIPKVVGGVTPTCLKVASALYGTVIDQVVEVSSTRAAELTKLLENIYRCVNIALVNELKMLTDKMGIDIWEVINASSTKPFGFQAFYPGPGLGGHCIPIDPFYLTWKAKEFDFYTRFIELAGEINTGMPDYVCTKVMDGLNESGKSLKGAKVLILGAAYKKDVDDMRESPSIHLIQILQDKGGIVDYHDPYVPKLPRQRSHSLDMESVDLNTIGDYDCVLISTDHSEIDYKWVVENSKLVVDARGVTQGMTNSNIVKA